MKLDAFVFVTKMNVRLNVRFTFGPVGAIVTAESGRFAALVLPVTSQMIVILVGFATLLTFMLPSFLQFRRLCDLQ